MKTQYLSKALESSARAEEIDNPSLGRIGKGYRYGLTVASLCSIVVGCLLVFVVEDIVSGWSFLSVGILASLLLPSVLTYRCQADRKQIKVSYFVLFLRRSKTVYWRDICYKKIRHGSNGEPISLCLYDSRKKKQFHIDSGVVGFTRILRIAKKKNIPKLK